MCKRVFHRFLLDCKIRIFYYYKQALSHKSSKVLKHKYKVNSFINTSRDLYTYLFPTASASRYHSFWLLLYPFLPYFISIQRLA